MPDAVVSAAGGSSGDSAFVVLDLRGLKCPLPVLRTRKRMRTLDAGDRIAVETTDPLAGIDIPHFCHQDGHVLESSETVAAGGHRFLIRKV